MISECSGLHGPSGMNPTLGPPFSGGNDLFGIDGPPEGFCFISVVFLDEPMDGRLALGDGIEDGVLQTPLGQFGEKPLDGIQPGGRSGREMEHPVGMPVKPGVDRVGLVRRIVVKNDMHVAALGKLTPDGVEEGDEFLVPVALHVLPDHRDLENFQGRKQGGGAVGLVVMGPGALSSSEAAPECVPAPGSATSRPPTERSHVPAGSRKARQCRAACPRMPDRSRT